MQMLLLICLLLKALIQLEALFLHPNPIEEEQRQRLQECRDSDCATSLTSISLKTSA